MDTPYSTSNSPPAMPRGLVRGRALRRLAVALTGAACALTVAGTSGTPSAVAAEPGGSAKVAKLTKEIKALEKEYGGSLEQLRDARQDANNSLEKAGDLKADLARARALVAQLAASQYMTNGFEPSVQILASDDPADVLNNATLASHVSQSQAARVQQIQTLVSQQVQARQEAGTKIKKLESDIKEIAQQRDRVKKLLKRFKPQSPVTGKGGMTPRMIKVRDEIDSEFGPFPTIGCTRPGDPQDHGTGRACDFMESTAGNMPPADRQAHGDRVAAYAIKNASRLGIKYIIWKQRIYDLRGAGAWKAMSDRGSITQNHFDHVHISVF